MRKPFEPVLRVRVQHEGPLHPGMGDDPSQPARRKRHPGATAGNGVHLMRPAGVKAQPFLGVDVNVQQIARHGAKLRLGSQRKASSAEPAGHRRGTSVGYNAPMNVPMPPLQEKVLTITRWLRGRVIGQETLLERLLMTLLCGGHLLVEGAPGLAKTRAVKELAAAVEGDFHRIQFTPDLLPSDVTGTEIYRPEDGSFRFQKGPVFHHLVLADEINRAPAKVQSALLEAMAEHQVSIGRETYALPDLFMVMATQNPIEQEGTYPLPEAQLDRFLMQVNVGYPDRDAEVDILRLVRSETRQAQEVTPPPARLTEADVFAARDALVAMHMAEPVERYLVELVMATREDNDATAGLLEFGASPRATLSLDLCARAVAWLGGRDFVTPEDVQAIAADCLRHRLLLTFEAEAEGISTDMVIERILKQVPSP